MCTPAPARGRPPYQLQHFGFIEMSRSLYLLSSGSEVYRVTPRLTSRQP